MAAQSVGVGELLIIAFVLILLSGGKKLPEFGKGMGEAVKDLRETFKEEDKKSKK